MPMTSEAAVISAFALVQSRRAGQPSWVAGPSAVVGGPAVRPTVVDPAGDGAERGVDRAVGAAFLVAARVVGVAVLQAAEAH